MTKQLIVSDEAARAVAGNGDKRPPAVTAYEAHGENDIQHGSPENEAAGDKFGSGVRGRINRLVGDTREDTERGVKIVEAQLFRVI